MRDRGQSDQDRILRSLEKGSINEDLDMTPAIMNKVRQIHQQRNRGYRAPRRKLFIITALSAVLVLSSITVYASNYLVQIKNKEGHIILTTTVPQKYYTSADEQKRREEYKEKLEKKLKPGEQAVYYIKDKQLNPDTSTEPLDYLYLPFQHPNYDELAKEIREKGAPLIQNPAYVPEGYTFESGIIQVTNEPILNTPEYKELLNELKEKAEKSKEEQELYYKVVPWKTPSSTLIHYRKGESQLTIIAFARPKGTTASFPSKEAVKLTVKGKEMIFSTSADQSHIMTWLSESETVLYRIYDDPKDPLSKDEFVKIARGIVKD